MRRISLSVLLVAICLLPVGIGSGASAHSHAVAALDGALANTARAQAQVLEDYFARAQSIDLLTANNPAFRRFYKTPGERAAKIRRGGPVLDEANEALGYLEQLFPDSIGEACFIDRAGPEIARMVRGKRATLEDLSPDESGAPFFGPTFALAHGQVYQARPYVSPDTKEWVISNSTLMPTADGSKPAIVHFEVTIESFRRVAASLGSQFDITVVDARTGQVVLDSRRPQQIRAPLGVPDDRRFAPVIAAGLPQGSSSVGDRPVAYQHLQRQRHNANDWYVMATARAPAGPLYGVSAWSIALVAVALALLVSAAISFLAQHRLLVATSMTDALTGIPNRRQLKLDLDQGLKDASPAEPLLLMLFDLNGFNIFEKGRLGQVVFARAVWSDFPWQRRKIEPQPRPAGLDWERFLGPAKKVPFEWVRYDAWRYFPDYGGGLLADILTHWADVAQWMMNETAPTSAVASGGVYQLRDGRVNPDTVNAVLQYKGGWNLTFESTVLPIKNERASVFFEGTDGTPRHRARRLHLPPE